jgi:hypothetical protein
MMTQPRRLTVALSAADRTELTKVVSQGVHPARMIARARVLLALDVSVGPVATRPKVARHLGVSENLVFKVAKEFTETGGNLGVVISRKKRLTPPVPAVVTGEVTLRLLEKHVVLSEDLPDLDHTTIGRVLKKRNCGLI